MSVCFPNVEYFRIETTVNGEHALLGEKSQVPYYLAFKKVVMVQVAHP